MPGNGTTDGFPSVPDSYEVLMDSLTDAQHRAATEGPDARILVTAGAGTGKTQLLVARLATLVREWELNPGQELVVLSFTRAAVRAVKERLKVAGGSVGYVTVTTFDSYATRLLSLVRPTGAWQTGSYDDRIAEAIETIRSGEADPFVTPIRHLLVDETQDLVHLRAELVEALLERIAGGFTLLGDPAQSIYNWQLEGRARRDGSAALYRWVRRRCGDGLLEISLDENFRAQTDVARSVLWAGPALNAADPDFEEIWERLHAIVAEAPSLGNARAAAAALLDMEPTPTAVLTRTNAEALKFSRLLDGENVPHRIQRRFAERAVAPWVAKVLGTATSRRIGRSAFEQALADVSDPSTPESSDAWRLLRRMVRGPRTDTLDLAVLADRIRTGQVPDELNWTPPAWLVVSTIHRAKGLEFDRVVVLDGRPAEDDEVELAEETRTLYVALTRARRAIVHAKRPNTFGFTKLGDRWYRRGKQYWQVHDIELTGDDVHWMDPAGGFLIGDRDPGELQTYIGRRVRPGDPVALVRTSGRNGGDDERVFYEIQHAGTPVGVTAESFGGTLLTILRRHHRGRVNWPSEIKNVTVDAVDTVAGTEAAGTRAGLGPAALWLRVRVTGLGYLQY
jgi:superfamily I DNA/RNA helicase